MHDLKFPAIFKIRAHPIRSLKCERLRPVAEALESNLRRLEDTARAVPAMVWRAMRVQHAWDVAVFQKTGGLQGTHAGRMEAQYEDLASFVLAAFDKRERMAPEHLTLGLENGVENLAHLTAADPMLHVGMEAILSAILMQAWTTFAVLASDLWERAVNVFPQKLATLRGLAGRIENRCVRNPTGARVTREKADGKIASLEGLLAASDGTYDLHERMGTLLKARYAFPALHGIWEAYSEAFHEKTLSIDEVLSRDGLPVLSLVRDLIWHRGGVADRVYVETARELKGAPKLALGARLEVTAELVATHADPAIQAAVDLLQAVDEWVG